MSQFQALEVAMQLVTAMLPIIERVEKHDRKMADQIRTATGSIPANLGEGSLRMGKDRRYHYSVAAGSARELALWLRMARAWKYIDDEATGNVAELLDRTIAMSYRLVNPRP